MFRDTINLKEENFDNDEIRVLSEMLLGTMIINKIITDRMNTFPLLLLINSNTLNTFVEYQSK